MMEKIMCPYCGPWNGHPDGVEMELQSEKSLDGTPLNAFFCPVCLTYSPVKYSEKEAREAASRRFEHRYKQKPMTLVEAQSIKESIPVFLEHRFYRPPEYVVLSTQGTIRYFVGLIESVPWNLYGKRFRFWRNRPTTEERDKAIWED